MSNPLPWTCPKHPQAQVRHSWAETRYAMNGYPVGRPIRTQHRYECAECGLELADERIAAPGAADRRVP